MKNNGRPNEVILKGIITVADWDEDCNVTAIYLSTPDEKEYLVGNNDKGEELFHYITRNVKVIGIIGEDKYGKEKITVNEYKLL